MNVNPHYPPPGLPWGGGGVKRDFTLHQGGYIVPYTLDCTNTIAN